MKRLIIASPFAALLLAVHFWSAPPVLAQAGQIPTTIPYHGKVTVSAGQQIPQANLQFRLYDAARDGTRVWCEIHKGVPVVGGHFAVNLGDTDVTAPDGGGKDCTNDRNPSVPLAQILPLFRNPLWLTVAINGSAETARKPLGAVPYALRARSVQELPPGMIAPFFGNDTPEGWLIADGSTIDSQCAGAVNDHCGPQLTALVAHLRAMGAQYRGAAATQAVLPDLMRMFLRGRRADEVAGRLQLDAIQRHRHEDGGHGHTDNGHAHAHTHTHGISDYFSTFENVAGQKIPGSGNADGGADLGLYYKTRANTSGNPSSNNTSGASASIQTGYASIGDPTSSSGDSIRYDSETRPVNVAVTYVIKY